MSLTIHSRHDGYRRCGVVHTTQPVTYADDRFSAEELDRLRSDPHLVVIEHAATASVPEGAPTVVAGVADEQAQGASDEVLNLGNVQAVVEQPAAAPTSAKKKPR